MKRREFITLLGGGAKPLERVILKSGAIAHAVKGSYREVLEKLVEINACATTPTNGIAGPTIEIPCLNR